MVKQFGRKGMAWILVWVMIFCTMIQMGSVKAIEKSKVFTGDGYEISITLQNSWESGYIANVEVKNTGTHQIKNWQITTAGIEGEITNVWNVVMEEKKGEVLFSYETYNRCITIGETISFGYHIEGGKLDDIIDMKLMESANNNQSGKTYSISYNIDSQWDNEATITANINNISEKNIEDWKLEFDFVGVICNIWNADITSHADDHYIIVCKDYNAVISSNSTVSFGFQAKFEEGQVECPGNNQLIAISAQKDAETTTQESETTEASETTEEEFQIDWDDPTDTDGDGLTDVMENYKYFSDDMAVDTDLDGIEDGEEVKIGTEPAMSDTDEDGLNDGEERNQYKTNPTNEDTDEDGLIDGDEIVLGLDPLKKDTDENGILDGDEYFEQKVEKEKIDSDLLDDNEAILTSIKVKAKGNVNRTMEIEEYDGCLLDDDSSCVGKPIEITQEDIASGEIEFTLNDDYDIQKHTINGKITNGLLICYNDNKAGDTIPLETDYDSGTKTLTAPMEGEGIYFVLDAMDMFYTLGIDIDEVVGDEEIVANTKLRAKSVNNSKAIDIKGKADIVFIVDTSESMDYFINNVKNNLSAFVEALELAGVSARFALVEYKDITVDGPNSTKVKKDGKSTWFKNVSKFKAEIGKLGDGGGGDLPETPIDALEKARRLKMRKSADKFFVLVTDAGYKTDNSYGVESMEEEIDNLVEDEIIVSVVTDSYNEQFYRDLYEKTNGVYAVINDRYFKDNLLNIANNIGEEINDGYWIALKGLSPQVVKLKEKPSAESKADTDGDSVPDNQELTSLTPTDYIDVNTYLRGIKIKAGGTSYKVPVYNFNSKPSTKDTDKDGILDKNDTSPKTVGIYSVTEGKVVIGELMLVSSSHFPVGHAFLVYKSYVNTTLNLKGLTGGYKYKTWEYMKPCKYKVKRNEYVALGNAGKALNGCSNISESASNKLEDNGAGVYFNREFAYEHQEGKSSYTPNAAYKRQISTKQMKKILAVCKSDDYYNIITNNCAELAVHAWNKAYPNDKFATHLFPKELKREIENRINCFIFNMSKEVPNIR